MAGASPNSTGLHADDKPDINHDAIFKTAQKCQWAFEKISQSDCDDAKALTRIRSLFTNFVKSPVKPIITLDNVRDDFEQFRVWAKNLGVFAVGQASLDYRLRDATDLRDGFVSLLESLSTELTNCSSLLETDGPDCPVGDHDVSSGSSSDSDDSYVSDLLASSTTKRTAFELQIRLKHVSDIIDKTIRLAEVIRSSNNGSRATKAAAFVHWENGINMTELFEVHYLPAILRTRFDIKDAKEYLLNRLVQAISLRRRRFMYQAKHQKRLAYGGELNDDPAPVKSKPELLAAVSQAILLKTQTLPQQRRFDGPSLVSTPTKATTFQNMIPKPKVPSRIVSSGTKTLSNQVVVPPPPRVPARATHFQCPYCYILIPTQQQTPKLWRAHVIADLQPYICLEPDCQSPNIVLSTQKEWLEHQRWEHVMEWWCDGDHPCVGSSRFTVAEDFAEHLRQVHDLSEAQLISKRIAAGGRPASITFSCCPFCDFTPWTAESLTNVAVVNTTQRQLQNHIADELLKIFLIALPDRDDLIDSESDTEAPSNARSTIESLSNISLSFGDGDRTHDEIENQGLHLESRSHRLPEENSSIQSRGRFWTETSLSNTNDDQSHTLTAQEESTLQQLGSQVYVPPCDADSCDTIWRIVWASPELSGGIRETYIGHDSDEILKSFMPRSNSSPTTVPARSDFQVALISTSEYGYWSALNYLDEQYDVHWPDVSDTCELYIGGRMGQHNVIIVKPSLASVDAVSMQHLFPSMQITLIVDYGHRAPNSERVLRCGDVVVGVSTSLLSDVMAPKYGNDRFPLVCPLSNQPPTKVLDAISKIKHAPGNEGYRIHDLLGVLRRRYPTWNRIHNRPDDIMSIASVTRSDEGDIAKDQHPVVHYGLIAPADSTMKTVRVRDSLTKVENALCFTDSSDISLHISNCLTIRGIVDYEHGLVANTDSCYYASASAAAYTRLLLSYIPAKPSVQSEALQRRQRFLDSLAVESMIRHFNNIADAHQGTSEWLKRSIADLTHSAFHQMVRAVGAPPDTWILSQEPHVLWLQGDRAAGKSVLMKHAVLSDNRDAPWTKIHFFFDAHGDPEHNSLSAMFKSFSHQLLYDFTDLQDALDSHEYLEDQSGKPVWNLDEPRRIFSLVVSRLGDRRVLCFIDGLNNCSDYNYNKGGRKTAARSLLGWFLDLLASFSRQCCICISTEVELLPFSSQNRNWLNLSKHSGHFQDIYNYAHELLSLDKPTSSAISAQIAARSRGNFLWAEAIVILLNDWLCSHPPSGLTEQLSRFPDILISLSQDILHCHSSNKGNTAVIRLLLSRKFLRFGQNISFYELVPVFKYGVTQILQMLLNDGDPDIIQNNEFRGLAYRYEILNAAVERQEINLVRAILERAVIDPRMLKSTGATALYRALYHKNAAILELLLRHNIIENNDVDSHYLLQETIRIGSYQVVKMVIEKLFTSRGRYIEYSDNPMSRGSMLRTVLKTDRIDIFELVLAQYDFDVSQPQGLFNETLLSATVEDGSLNILNLLLARSDVDVNAVALGGPLMFSEHIVKSPEVVLGVVQALLSRDGFDINTSRGGPSILELALLGRYSPKICDLILEKARAHGLVD